jgi:FKBP-type peptidyl-prolyl cis-trans isomerase FklB
MPSRSRLDLAPGFPDSPRTEKQSMQSDKYMKLFFILTLALGLVAGCGVKEEQAVPEKKPGAKLNAGESFLAENAKKEGVKTTASGLQYKVIKSGTGASPRLADTVKVHYHGTLIDGTVFDSSVERGEPISFPVGGVIAGWVEALQLMKVGDKWQLFIPAKLAYGEQSPSPKIAPNSTLLFEVELLGIEK